MERDDDNDIFGQAPAERAPNWYEQKQEARRERMMDRAERLRETASQEFRKADLREEYSGIPFGQPILVGHHSERRHRKVLERADKALGRGVEALKHAEELERRASSPSNAISSDDPDAVVKLREKIEKAETLQTAMREANKLVRAAYKRGVRDETAGDLWDIYARKLQEVHPSFTAKAAAELLKGDFCGRIGFPDYALSNNNANIRRLKLRQAQLAKAAEAETVEREPVDGLRVVENVEENRIQLMFDGKPADDVRAMLKSLGFRWAPSMGAWQRQLNNSGRWNAERFGTWYAARQEGE